MKDDPKSMHKRGMRFLESRRVMLPDVRQQTIEWSELAKLGRNTQAKVLRDHLAMQFVMDKKEYLHDIRFAAAVETIVENCGPYARELLLAGKTPQAPKGIMQLSRTSDTRQRHRVEGVRDGRFHSVAPHCDDLVFDTVEFREVTSRLRRARGWFGLLPGQLKNGVEHSVRDESRRLAGLCSNAADALQTLVATGLQTQITVPTKLRKDVVFPTMKNRDVRGKAIGFVRRALRFTIKSVWDFPEMRERSIFPTDVEKHQTIQETNEIIAIAEDILRQ